MYRNVYICVGMCIYKLQMYRNGTCVWECVHVYGNVYQFGTHFSQALLNTVYYYNSKVFGLRSFDEHRNLRCTQFNKKVDEKKSSLH